MPELHPDFEAAVEVGEELAQEKRESLKARAGVPFGMQTPPAAAQFRKDFDERGEEFRRKILGEMGRDAVFTKLGLKKSKTRLGGGKR